ncbi:PREDICTED: uncharacterized protein LOC109159384 [Ipomoea nil]|uniref:uncharacterized protein LOC109159384 n=1 Tax=Ipomoea nil TaxID=35883 RepID=UPI000901B25F|nr:PREDICTED: uncharacterized protein LOC109159384 [Ipomoea nil]
MAWNGTTIRPTATTTAPAPAATHSGPVQANSDAAGANFDPNDAASPFFLHPNENPSLILVSTLLDGRNYHPWARAMEMSLLSKNKLGFVDGTIPMPNVGEVKYPYWRRCNNMVATWIMRSVSPEIAQTILWGGTTERVWNTLKARFSEADVFRISDLHAEIHQTRQGDLSVSTYFAKLKVLWDELQVIRPLPTCKCERRCDCGLLQTLEQQLESDNLSVFLRGLNDTYASVQSQIMMTKPLPTVDEAFLMIQQQERRFIMQEEVYKCKKQATSSSLRGIMVVRSFSPTIIRNQFVLTVDTLVTLQKSAIRYMVIHQGGNLEIRMLDLLIRCNSPLMNNKSMKTLVL